MKNYFTSIVSYYGDDKKRILWTSLWIVGSLAALCLFPWILGFGLCFWVVFGIGYKLFTGFPSVFGTLVQFIAFAWIALCVCGLIMQGTASDSELQKAAISVATFIMKYSHAPKSLIGFIATELGAWSGIGIGIIAGLLGEITCSLTIIGAKIGGN